MSEVHRGIIFEGFRKIREVDLHYFVLNLVAIQKNVYDPFME